MKHLIRTRRLSAGELREEFGFCVQYLQKTGYDKVSVLFGWAWGNDYYPTDEWRPEQVPLAELESKVRQVERSGIGTFGADDLFVEVMEHEFTFCHESDVHLEYEVRSEVTEAFWERWSKLGYSPAEYLKNQERGPGELVRGGEKNA